MTCVDNKMWSNGVMLWRHIFITRGDRRICSLQTSRFPRVRAVIIFVDISIQPQDLTPLSRVRAWLLSLCGCWPASCSCSAQWWPTPASSARTSSPSSRSGKTPGLGLELSRCYPNFSYLVTISYNPSSVLLSCLCVWQLWDAGWDWPGIVSDWGQGTHSYTLTSTLLFISAFMEEKQGYFSNKTSIPSQLPGLCQWRVIWVKHPALARTVASVTVTRDTSCH